MKEEVQLANAPASPYRVKGLLISGEYYPPQVGGISQFIQQVVSTLGPDHVCGLTGVPAGSTDSGRDRIYRFPALIGSSRVKKAAAWGAALAQIIARDRPQVVMLGSADDSHFGLWLHRRLGLPFIVFAYGNEVLQTITNQFEQPKLAFKTANRVVAISEYTAGIAREAGADPARIQVIHPGCDAERFRPLANGHQLKEELLGPGYANKQIILTVGNLVSRKGHDVMIRSLPILKRQVSDFIYLIVGDGPYRIVLETLARDTGVQDSVRFMGKVPSDSLPSLHAISDLFAMPSRDQANQNDIEGFGLVFLEANACGKPVIGGRSGGVPDAVAEGVSGLLVDPTSPEDVAAALASLLTNAELAKRLGEQGRARVLRDFQWKTVGDSLLDTLKSVKEEGPLKIS